jgi:hypothetical protein
MTRSGFEPPDGQAPALLACRRFRKRLPVSLSLRFAARREAAAFRSTLARRASISDRSPYRPSDYIQYKSQKVIRRSRAASARRTKTAIARQTACCQACSRCGLFFARRSRARRVCSSGAIRPCRGAEQRKHKTVDVTRKAYFHQNFRSEKLVTGWHCLRGKRFNSNAASLGKDSPRMSAKFRSGLVIRTRSSLSGS